MKTDHKTFDLWHNGEYLPQNQPILTIESRIRLGDGVFDSMLIKNAQPVFLEEHIERALTHAKVLNIDCGYSPENLKQITLQFLNHNKPDLNKRFVLNTFMVRGEAQAKNDLILSLRPAPKAPQELHLIICETTRRNEHSPLSRIKSFNYGDHALAMREAQEKGAGDAILLNTSGNAACSTFGNIYADIDGVLYTPPLEDGAMDGVFRSKAIEMQGVQERTLNRRDLEEHAQGVYISNSIRGFYPALTINKKKLSKTDKCIKLF